MPTATTPAIPTDLIGLAEAASLLPSRKAGRRLHPVTVFRWIQRGRLEGWRIGGSWFVSRAAVLGMVELAWTTPELTGKRKRQGEIDEAWRKWAGRKG